MAGEEPIASVYWRGRGRPGGGGGGGQGDGGRVEIWCGAQDPDGVGVGRGDAAAAGLGGLRGHEPHGRAGGRRGGRGERRPGRGAPGGRLASAPDAVAAQRPRPHAPRPRQGVLRVPARHHRAGGGGDPRGGPARGGRRHPGRVAADRGGPLEQREGAAGAGHAAVAARLQVRLRRPAVPAGGPGGAQRGGHHLVGRVPVPPQVAQQARRSWDPNPVGQAESAVLHQQVEPLVHQRAVHHLHRAPDGRHGREDGLPVPAGELQDAAHPGREEGAEGEPGAGPGQRRAGAGAAAAHRDLRGAHVLHQQRGQAGLLHEPRQDRLLGAAPGWGARGPQPQGSKRVGVSGVPALVPLGRSVTGAKAKDQTVSCCWARPTPHAACAPADPRRPRFSRGEERAAPALSACRAMSTLVSDFVFWDFVQFAKVSRRGLCPPPPGSAVGRGSAEVRRQPGPRRHRQLRASAAPCRPGGVLLSRESGFAVQNALLGWGSVPQALARPPPAAGVNSVPAPSLPASHGLAASPAHGRAQHGGRQSARAQRRSPWFSKDVWNQTGVVPSLMSPS